MRFALALITFGVSAPIVYYYSRQEIFGMKPTKEGESPIWDDFYQLKYLNNFIYLGNIW
jgi:hypothetical protein